MGYKEASSLENAAAGLFLLNSGRRKRSRLESHPLQETVNERQGFLAEELRITRCQKASRKTATFVFGDLFLVCDPKCRFLSIAHSKSYISAIAWYRFSILPLYQMIKFPENEIWTQYAPTSLKQ